MVCSWQIKQFFCFRHHTSIQNVEMPLIDLSSWLRRQLEMYGIIEAHNSCGSTVSFRKVYHPDAMPPTLSEQLKRQAHPTISPPPSKQSEQAGDIHLDSSFPTLSGASGRDGRMIIICTYMIAELTNTHYDEGISPFLGRV